MRTVLLVEDSKFLRIATDRVLVKAGYRVIGAGDGEEALRLAGESRPDVILLDMMLPKMSGQDVLGALKLDPKTAAIPVIVLTGLSDKNEQKLRKAGAAAFISKLNPTQEPGLLLDAIKEVLEHIPHV